MTKEKVEVGRSEVMEVIVDAITYLPPSESDAVRELLSIGVCIRCMLRLFGVRGRVYSLSSSSIHSVLEKASSVHNAVEEDGVKKPKDSNGCHPFPNESTFCSICLGILQFSYSEGKKVLEGKDEVSDFTVSIAEDVKREGHEINKFEFEISVPPTILANECALRAYLKKKYGSELWFREKLIAEHISLKDALKFSITSSLETLLDAKYGVSSFHICLTYTEAKTSQRHPDSQDRDQGCKRRKTGITDFVDDGMECVELANGERGPAIDSPLSSLQSSEHFNSLLEKVKEPCCLTNRCYRTPVYIGGRYLKYSRNVSQTRWIIDDERKGEASVEELIGNVVLPFCGGDNYKFHAAGREDIDVRMLGSGRPFLIEVQNARHDLSKMSMEEIEEKINTSDVKLVRVRNVKVVGIEGWNLMREGEAEKQKQYAALVWISRSLKDEDLQAILSLKDMKISQRTPIRVLHRRSPLDRERIIHWMKVERVPGSTQYFLLHLCTQAGTYIKEFVHGDLGRTFPSLGSILGCRAEILQLDVTDVKMDCFN